MRWDLLTNTEIWKASWRGLKVWSRVNILYFTKNKGQNKWLVTGIHFHFSFFFFYNSCCCYLFHWVCRRADRSEWRCCPCVSREESWFSSFQGRTSFLLPAWCRWDLVWLLSVFPSLSINIQRDKHLSTYYFFFLILSEPSHHQVNSLSFALLCKHDSFLSGQ